MKRIARKANIKVVFSAPEKLNSICRLTRPYDSLNREKGCQKKHRTRYVDCIEKVVYQIPLTCRRYYVGQTGRCANDRMREHDNNVKRAQDGWLAIHCRSCPCSPIFEKRSVVSKHRDRLTREVVEAYKIAQLGENCVSTPSIALLPKEMEYLRRRLT